MWFGNENFLILQRSTANDGPLWVNKYAPKRYVLRHFTSHPHPLTSHSLTPPHLSLTLSPSSLTHSLPLLSKWPCLVHARHKSWSLSLISRSPSSLPLSSLTHPLTPLSHLSITLSPSYLSHPLIPSLTSNSLSPSLTSRSPSHHLLSPSHLSPLTPPSTHTHRFTDLLTPEVINRDVLRWVSAWGDYIGTRTHREVPKRTARHSKIKEVCVCLWVGGCVCVNVCVWLWVCVYVSMRCVSVWSISMGRD